MESFVKPPNLLIYLKSSVPNLVNQIQSRGEIMKKVFASII